VGDGFVIGTLVMFHSLRKTGAQADFVAMTANISQEAVKLLERSGIIVKMVEPLIVTQYHSNYKSDVRDSILWTKLRVWQLEEYSKIIMLDSDLFVLQNSDELFNYPEFASTPMVDTSEKTLFFLSPEMGLRPRNKVKQDAFFPQTSSLLPHWSGVNSGYNLLIKE
jgi:alpha-N-acetylglucosamine transferase